MKPAIIALTCIALLHCSARSDEFVGPFPSWKNVKTDYGAVGDGKADDTDAIQKGLDDLRLHKQSNVLYIPPGTYRITRTLATLRKAHTECMGVAVIGEDPAGTIIRWDGPADQIMFHYDAWYSKISRLTLDGRGKAKVALAYGGGFSTYNETSDMVFQDVGDGMAMATGNNGQAENEVLRCTFRRCSARASAPTTSTRWISGRGTASLRTAAMACTTARATSTRGSASSCARRRWISARPISWPSRSSTTSRWVPNASSTGPADIRGARPARSPATASSTAPATFPSAWATAGHGCWQTMSSAIARATPSRPWL